MVDDSDFLAGLVRSDREAPGLDRRDVALSIFVQGYAYRVASVAIGAWVLDGVVLDVSPSNMAFGTKEGRPSRIRFAAYRTAARASDLETLHRALVDRHLAGVVEQARRVMRIGAPLLWGNVGSSCASSFGALMGSEDHARVRDSVIAFFRSARPELAASGRVVPVGSLWAWERRACCLWYRSPVGTRCVDCSLWTDEEREQRYDRVRAAEAK